MFNSIFRRLVAIFITVVITGFSITGVMLYFFLGNFVSNERKVVLSEAASAISNYLKDYLENSSNFLARLYLNNILDSYYSYTEALIFVVNEEGYIVISRPEINRVSNDIIKNFIYEDGYYKISALEQHVKLINSGNI